MKVLVVEDTETIALSIKSGLETFGYTVDVALDGLEGYDLALNEKYDVIILDIMLPGKDGRAVLTDLRAADVATPVLFLTARGTTADKVEGLGYGADDYLVKPFVFAELVARVQALARRPQTFQSDVISFAGLEIDTSAMAVSRFDQPVSLSKREFALLEYLVRHQKRVVSKDTILENVWEFDSDVLPNTVEVYVGYLRSKLEKPFPKKPKFIKTVRGFGYTVTEET